MLHQTTPENPGWPGRIWPDGQMRQPANPDFQVWFDNIFLLPSDTPFDIDFLQRFIPSFIGKRQLCTLRYQHLQLLPPPISTATTLITPYDIDQKNPATP